MKRLAAALLTFYSVVAAADEPPTVVERPTYLRTDTGFGAPTGIFGLTVGHAIDPPWALEAGAGLGLSGFQLALLARWYRPIRQSRRHSFTVAAGPSLSLIGKVFGLNVQHVPEVDVDEGDIFYIAGLNVEVGWEVRFHWGGIIRASIGGFLRVAETMSHLCPEETSGARDGPCGSLHYPTASEIARVPAYPYLVVGYGWSF